MREFLPYSLISILLTIGNAS
ncbi:hypothetical protein THF1C08_20049 [Vibrio jasicida]|uniref:Uncharacterized protein n=1 Tax=Vibrio jasicida TaxID=766224 RepID=A0AAU9QM44_9VIBR|nr:hypothetical protein THF1C08_20049 [Vibrio jasicida]CAH1584180.1 hypothetical protein THF1A12_20049 [Vibrio jasicida]